MKRTTLFEQIDPVNLFTEGSAEYLIRLFSGGFRNLAAYLGSGAE